jgi:hypothetical protein
MNFGMGPSKLSREVVLWNQLVTGDLLLFFNWKLQVGYIKSHLGERVSEQAGLKDEAHVCKIRKSISELELV